MDEANWIIVRASEILNLFGERLGGIFLWKMVL